MIPKQRRISSSEFSTITLSPDSLRGAFFSIKTAFLKKATASQFAIVVSKKIAQNAVDRNKIRRRAYGVIGKNFSLIPPGLFIVLYANKGVKTASFDDIEQDIKSLLSKLKNFPLKKAL